MTQPTHKKSDIVIACLHAACVAQFLFTLIYVNFYCKPLNQLHVAIVGLSAICGILLSGIIRRSYKSLREYWDKKIITREVDEIVSKIKEQKPQQ
jgi:hypothetical protein